MCGLESFKLDLKRLEEGTNALQFTLDDAYFKAMECPEVERGNVSVDMQVKRTGDMFDISYHVDGVAIVPCDRCLTDMEQPVEADSRVVARLGQQDGEDGEVIVVDENDGTLDVAWMLCETVALALPVKHVHEPGKCNPEMEEKLKQLAAGNGADNAAEGADPRWSKLKDLKI